MIHRVNNLLHTVLLPIHFAVNKLHDVKKARIFKKKRHAKVAVGVVIMITGSTLASHPLGFIPHVLWDAFAYGLHGYGALPVVKLMCEKFNLETLDEEEE